MFCEISETQKAIVKKLIGNILKRLDSYSKTPERIIKEVYDIAYEQFVKAGLTKDNRPMMTCLQLALHASTILRSALITDDPEMRKKIQKLTGIEDKFTPEYFEKLSTAQGIKDAVGLKDTIIEKKPQELGIPTTVLESIMKAFPQVVERKKYIGEPFPGKKSIWGFKIVGETKMPEVTHFVKGLTANKYSFAEYLETNARTLVDYVMKHMLKSKLSFEQDISNLLADKRFQKIFGAFFKGKRINEVGEIDIIDPIYREYAKQLIKDASYSVNFIREQYKDYYVTDLTELLDATVGNEEKERFFIYSTDLGLIGELDLIAIAPDGTFKMLKITNAYEGVNKIINKNEYIKQLSTYDLIFNRATGLKSQGKVDIIYFDVFIHSPSTLVTIKRTDVIDNYRKKINILKTSVITSEKLPANDLTKEIDVYIKRINSIYKEEFKSESQLSITQRNLINYLRSHENKRKK